MTNATTPWQLPWTPEEVAERFHKAYEYFAPRFGYTTRPETAVAWDEVPENNKALMIAVVRNVFIEQLHRVQSHHSESSAINFNAAQQGENMTVRAKFYVQSITTSKAWNGPGTIGTVHLSPVSSGSDENKKFYEATPGGKIELGTVNGEALKQFNIGDEFYVDFTPAPQP